MSNPSRSSNALNSRSAQPQSSSDIPESLATQTNLVSVAAEGEYAKADLAVSNLASSENSDCNFQPLVRRLPRSWTAEYCFDRLRHLPGCVWLDSNLQSGKQSRFSYLSADPFSVQRIIRAYPGCLHRIKHSLQQYFQAKLPDLPPFQGGWLGWFGYELGSAFEVVPTARYDDFKLPAAVLGAYDVVLSWDHQTEEGFIVSQGWPRFGSERAPYAYRRLKKFLSLLEAETREPAQAASPRATSQQQLAPQFETRWKDWTSNFDSASYRKAVAACVEYIHAGDIFQANLSQRLLCRSRCESSELYKQLRVLNRSPFAGYADFGRVQVLSCSPERFVQLNDGAMEARPIKGTRPRLSIPTADRGMATLLRTSQKDISENVMIVDLLRNDLSRVAEPASVRVPALCEVEQYPYVWHLVSTIVAELQHGLDATDLIAASFPGGSITGAPKIRAMEIIAELEPTVRGPYCGSLGYISFAGDMDLNILIRTLTVCDGWWQVPVGGGIVAESDPVAEEQETWHKAEGMLRAIDRIR